MEKYNEDLYESLIPGGSRAGLMRKDENNCGLVYLTLLQDVVKTAEDARAVRLAAYNCESTGRNMIVCSTGHYGGKVQAEIDDALIDGGFRLLFGVQNLKESHPIRLWGAESIHLKVARRWTNKFHKVAEKPKGVMDHWRFTCAACRQWDMILRKPEDFCPCPSHPQ